MYLTKSIATLCAALLAMLALALPAAAQDDSTDYPVNTITVTGAGTVSGEPNIARIEIGVEVTEQDVQSAFSSANNTIDQVIAAIEETGVAPDDIRTTGLNIFAQERPPEPPGPAGQQAEPQRQYTVSNRVRVIVRDIDAIEEVINAAVEAGANNIYNLQFDIDDPASLKAEARQRAVEDAREQAQQLADLLGVSLGQPILVNASGGAGPVPVMADTFGRGGGGGAVIEPGTLNVTIQVQITYRITGSE